MPDPLSPEFDRWVSELTADDERAHRARRTWLVRQAEQEATLRGALIDLAEARVPVVVALVHGRQHQGLVRLVGVDVAGIETPTGLSVLFPLRSLAAVRTAGATTTRSTGVTGDRETGREVQTGPELASILGLLAERRAEALVELTGAAAPVRGEVESVGSDVLRLRVDGAGSAAFIPLAAIGAIVVSEDLYPAPPTWSIF